MQDHRHTHTLEEALHIPSDLSSPILAISVNANSKEAFCSFSAFVDSSKLIEYSELFVRQFMDCHFFRAYH